MEYWKMAVIAVVVVILVGVAGTIAFFVIFGGNDDEQPAVLIEATQDIIEPDEIPEAPPEPRPTPEPVPTPRPEPVHVENRQALEGFLHQKTSLFTGIAHGWGEVGENLWFIPAGNLTWEAFPLDSIDDVPYIFWHSDWEYPENQGFFDRYGNRITTAPYINNEWIVSNFTLFDFENDGFPEILLHWSQYAHNGAYPFSLFRYIDGEYHEMDFAGEGLGENWGHNMWSFVGQAYRFYMADDGRLVLFGASGGGGIESIGFLTFEDNEAYFNFIGSWDDLIPPYFYEYLTPISNLSALEEEIRESFAEGY